MLTALARGVLGKGYIPEVPKRMWDLISNAASDADQKQLLGLLRLLDTKAGALLFTGRPTPVSWLSPREAEALVQRWKASSIKLHRVLAGLAISASTTSLYAHPGPDWTTMGYAGPLGDAPSGPKPLDPITIETDEVVNCDVVVVGSGAGGGCVAAGLAASGYSVVILEKGGYFAEPDFHHNESQAMRELYLYASTLTSSDLRVRIIAGSAVGGGTLVNYATAFRTPDHVLKEWARVSGIDAFISGEIDESLDVVCKRVNVTFDESEPGRRDSLMEEGCQKLGWHVAPLPRAVRDCGQDAGCGYCGMGCRRGAKQGTMKTFLEDAVKSGARIFTGADVERVTIKDGVARGVSARVGDHRLTVNARAVVSAAGSIETPALLLRSGLKGEVGKNLRLHPGLASWGFFDEDVRIWEGTTQARYCAEFAEWDGGYGPIFETVPIHPGAGGSAFPWLSAAQHRDLVARFANISFVAVLPRDEAGGRVKIRRDGSPKVDYKITPGDDRRITEGAIRAGRVLEAAGATKIHSPHPLPIEYTPGPGAHEKWAEEVRARGVAGQANMFSYHQMGSCRMGTDPKKSAIDASNQTHEVKNLFVTDASTFPTASGVNPMVSIYGIAHRAAKKIAEHLG
ncbi:MAG TPA: GMC family oxidoreductase [Actinomycetota bacterium]|nr:GMC family oxidoreductase [Actinomycetota bacterium]